MNTLELTQEEKIVYDFIRENKKVTQLQIARGCPSLGSHKRHEGYISSGATLRKVRQIVRDLRINKGIYILSDRSGYWIMEDIGEALTFLERKEKEAKAAAKSFMVTYNCMRKMFGVKSDYFEKQLDLFNEQ